jgi:tRNA-splicing ligase RtcB
MPDVHLGMGSTVGTVIATKGAIMPACVGVDIGCGMIAARTNLSAAQIRPKLKAIREGIERRIPVGVGKHGQNTKVQATAVPRIAGLEKMEAASAMHKRMSGWPDQLGSLGGGNHFIEISEDETGSVWAFLHSGSRGVGNKTGMHWTKLAQNEARKRGDFDDLPDRDLAYLTEGTEPYDDYVREARWCQRYAMLNREEMMERVLAVLSQTFGDVAVSRRVNCHHNYLAEETYVVPVMITRKGAIAAHRGQDGLIPGSMGTGSYVVSGLGNEESYNSAPHGAGRRLSRNAARAQFTLGDLRDRMSGIESRVRPELLDEHPDAYKDIEVVMREASPLVKPEFVLKQLISVKGD